MVRKRHEDGDEAAPAISERVVSPERSRTGGEEEDLSDMLEIAS